MAKKRGGQTKPASEKLTAKLLLSMLESESAAFQQAADLYGLKKSAWMRMRLREAANKDMADHGLRPPFLPKIASGEKGNRTQRA
jgi:hypothetical protein